MDGKIREKKAMALERIRYFADLLEKAIDPFEIEAHLYTIQIVSDNFYRAVKKENQI